MFDGIVAVVHVLLAVAGPLAASDGALLAVAVVVAAAAIITVLGARTGREPSVRGAHPWRAIDASTALAQSDPDAAGHPRPRAPGSAAPAA